MFVCESFWVKVCVCDCERKRERVLPAACMDNSRKKNVFPKTLCSCRFMHVVLIIEKICKIGSRFH